MNILNGIGKVAGKINPIRSSIIINYLEEENVADGSFVVEITIHECKDLTSVSLIDGCNPYVQINIEQQIQSTPHKNRTLDPKWVPGESFKFAVVDGNVNIIISVFHKNLIKPTLIGYVPIKVSQLVNEKKYFTKNLFHPDTGAPLASTIIFEACLSNKQDAFHEIEQYEYEYERWQPIVGWGQSYPGHLLPTDPGSFSNHSCDRFGKKFEEVEPNILDGYEADIWQYLTTKHSAEGWIYSTDMKEINWYDEMGMLTCVRRRKWKRSLKKNNQNDQNYTTKSI